MTSFTSDTAAAAARAVRAAADDPASLLKRFRQVRRLSEAICEPLETEDFVVQSMPDASPAKWHLAHTTWFFETFVLAAFAEGYERPQPAFNYLFNSYYNAVGPQFERPRRGLLSRPTVADVYRYREHVDAQVATLLNSLDDDSTFARLEPIVTIGLHHEQQHQELMLTDLKHMLSLNPLKPVYSARESNQAAESVGDLWWKRYAGGVVEIGHQGDAFAYDNESPRHKVFLNPFEIGSRLVTNAEYIEFMNEGGYARPELWLSEGWRAVQDEQWRAPLCWRKGEDGWRNFTLAGESPVDGDEPVCHISLFEADAYARWAGARLPTEEEWEVAAFDAPVEGHFVESRRFHPAPLDPGAAPENAVAQLFGDVWEWTGSQYRPYPGYRPPEGALSEYNGKFMSNQFVLRGGSCATSWSHIRRTYRNFFHPAARWQFTGIRLARDVSA